MVPTTIAVADRDVGAPALVDLSRPVADAARIVLSDTIVDDVTYTVAIGIGHAVAPAHAEHIELVPTTIAVADRDVGAPAFEHGAGAIANATDVKFAHTVVLVVAHPVAVQVVQAGVDTLSAIVEVQARAVVDVGARVEVACQDMDAPRVEAAAVVVVGASVEVHRHRICASAHHVGVEPNVEPQIVLVVTLRKHLHAHGAAQVAVGRQLGQEHPQVRSCKGVGRCPRDDRPPRSTLAVFHEPLT